MNKQDMPSFKVILVGDVSSGKTTFMERHISGEFQKNHVATLGVELYALEFQTNRGPIQFIVWDTAGEKKFGSLPSECYKVVQGALIFFDFTNDSAYENVIEWHSDLKLLCQNIPIVVCGNKCDLKNRCVTFPREMNVKFYAVSAKSQYNFEKPFLWLANRLIGDPNLQLVPILASWPPEIVIDETLKLKLEREGQEAKLKPLPDDDEDIVNELLTHFDIGHMLSI